MFLELPNVQNLFPQSVDLCVARCQAEQFGYEDLF